MLNVLARIGIALAGLVLGLVGGWAAIVVVISVFALDDGRAVDFLLLPLIMASIIAGGVVGLIAGLILPLLWKRRRLAEEA